MLQACIHRGGMNVALVGEDVRAVYFGSLQPKAHIVDHHPSHLACAGLAKNGWG